MDPWMRRKYQREIRQIVREKTGELFNDKAINCLLRDWPVDDVVYALKHMPYDHPNPFGFILVTCKRLRSERNSAA